MITEISVDGFKSLNNFELTIRPGLNVLVGPNGSGKSNILSFFEFLSNISRYQLPEAVSRSGGAGNIFRRLPDQEITNKIKLSVGGRGKSQQGVRRFPHSPYFTRRTPEHYVHYRYSSDIELGDGGTSLKYTSQRVSFSVFRDPQRRPALNKRTGDYRWHVDIKIKIENGNVLIETNKINYKAVRDAIQSGASKIYDFFLLDIDEVSNIPLFNVVERFIGSALKIRSDITSGYIYNLNPNEIKKSEDIARPAEISQNGSGLAATLFYIQEKQNKKINMIYGPFQQQDDGPNYQVSLKNLKQIFCLINDNISDVRVENDALENKLIVIAKVQGYDNSIDVPLTMLSDGTVKWFSLVTAILSRKAIFSIEEPENFLHPHMQKEIVDILRRNSEGESDIFSLITTHSESFLNALDPDEIVVTTMKKGATYTSRSEDAEIIRKEINESGFGLGYFYVSGVIQ